MTADMHFDNAMVRVQNDDIITSKKGILFQSGMIGKYQLVKKFKVICVHPDHSLCIEPIKAVTVDAYPVNPEQEAGNDN